jgi:hypothetical protein
MKARLSLAVGTRLRSLAVLLAPVLLASSAWAAQRIPIPQDMPLPLYAAGFGHTGFDADDLVGTAFYYPPELIPGDYDLFNMPVYDFPVGVEPSFVEGFLIVDGSSPNPLQVVLQNAPGALVPIWFTRVGDWNDIWTVNELLSQEPLVGWADFYREIQEPADPSRPDGPWHHQTVASGVMEDGRTFFVWSDCTQARGKGYESVPDLIVHFRP